MGIIETEEDMGAYELIREVLLTGIAVVVPLLIVFYVGFVLVDFVLRILRPLLKYVGTTKIHILAVMVALGLSAVVLAVGFVAHSPFGERAIDNFDEAIGRVPGFGTVYRSFRRMGDAMIESDADNFQDVQLLEFPTDGAYTIVFVTADTPDRIQSEIGNGEMTTVFLPMAPNPVMGGFVVNVPDAQLVDVDLTLEEAFRAVVTSGVGIDGMSGSSGGLSEEELRNLTGYDVFTRSGMEAPSEQEEQERTRKP